MEPLGSITMYLPFVDEKTREVVTTIMNQSYNYADFVRCICKKVINEDSEQMLVYLAYRYANNLWDKDLVKRILEKYNQRYPLIPSWNQDHFDESVDAASFMEEILSNNPEPWIAYHMYELLAKWARTYTMGSIVEEISLKNMKQLLDSYEELAPLEPYLLWKQAEIFRSNGRSEDAVTMLEHAVELLTKYDDQAYLEKVYSRIAYCLRYQNPLKALNRLEMTKKLREKLGIVPVEYYNSLNIKGIVHSSIGEYDAAADSCLKAMELTEVRGTNIGIRFLPANLASIYNKMGKHSEALEYAKMALELESFATEEGSYWSYAHYQMTMSLTGLGRLDEALEHLRIAWELTLKSGNDHLVSLYHLALGFIERVDGNLVSAMQSFENALRLDKDNPRALVELTRIEVDLFTSTERNYTDDTSGPWMKRLDERVSTGYMPGFLGLAHLLKAELRRKQGRHEEKNELLQRVRELADDPKTGFLRNLLIQYVKVHL